MHIPHSRLCQCQPASLKISPHLFPFREDAPLQYLLHCRHSQNPGPLPPQKASHRFEHHTHRQYPLLTVYRSPRLVLIAISCSLHSWELGHFAASGQLQSGRQHDCQGRGSTDQWTDLRAHGPSSSQGNLPNTWNVKIEVSDQRITQPAPRRNSSIPSQNEGKMLPQVNPV